jgi:hypothetical protein
MRRLNGNCWRLGWIALTSGALILLVLTGPIRSHHDQQLIYESMRTATPAFSYWRELFRDPWVALLALVLLVGIVAEANRNALSPILNLAPLTFWLVSALRDPFYGRQLLLILPLALVIGVDVGFYVFAFKRGGIEGGDSDFHSRV